MAATVDLDGWERRRRAAGGARRARARDRGAGLRRSGLRASVDIEESDEEIRATVNGEDLGLLIGKHGSTIDALQHIAVARRLPRPRGAQARRRRRGRLPRAARGGAAPRRPTGRWRTRSPTAAPVELEPMGAYERKVVHKYLAERTEVETHSEGDEPERRLVVTPPSGRG